MRTRSDLSSANMFSRFTRILSEETPGQCSSGSACMAVSPRLRLTDTHRATLHSEGKKRHAFPKECSSLRTREVASVKQHYRRTEVARAAVLALRCSRGPYRLRGEALSIHLESATVVPAHSRPLNYGYAKRDAGTQLGSPGDRPISVFGSYTGM
jgi:hypothetical protein